jgi:YHS domain-containing protein
MSPLRLPTFAVLAAAATLSVSVLATSPAFALVGNSTSAVDTDEHGLAMQGYDPVAYFTEGKPHAGSPQFKVEHGGATYYFASAANMKKFTANPDAYLPQYGGFCAMGTSLSRKFEGDPKVWHVVDKKLYLNVNPDVDHKWSQDVPGNLSKANENWPQIKDKAPDELH